MSFSELFDTGFKKRNEGHFASLVRVAMAGGSITEEEKAYLDRLAVRLDIEEDEYNHILKNYQTYPINPPSSYDSRLERLYDHVRMIHVDAIKGYPEMALLYKIAVGLGFNTTNVKYIVDKALTLVASGADLDTFIEQIKNMNR